MPPFFSHSRLKSFDQCPLKYRYRYVDRIPSEIENIEAFTGKRVHEVIEELFGADRPLGPTDLPGALDRFDALWRERWSDRVRIVKSGFTSDRYRKMGRRCIENFFRLDLPGSPARTVGLEQRITVHLDPEGRYRMQGYIDRLAVGEDGVHEIHDYKTSARLPKPSDLDADDQLAIYHLGVEEMLGRETPARLVWHYLYHGRTLQSSRGRDRLQRLRADLIAGIQRIEAATDHPARVTPLCRWCDYESICPARRTAPGRRSASRARVEEGARLVDGYVAIKREVDSDRAFAGDRLDKAKERLLAFSRREGMEAVAGTTHMAQIRRRRRVRLPEPGTERRRALETYLRERRLWDGATDLDPDRLLWEIETAPPGSNLREGVRAFGSIEDASEVQIVPHGGGQLTFFE